LSTNISNSQRNRAQEVIFDDIFEIAPIDIPQLAFRRVPPVLKGCAGIRKTAMKSAGRTADGRKAWI
jgi:hypothetical protein